MAVIGDSYTLRGRTVAGVSLFDNRYRFRGLCRGRHVECVRF
ncbi:MAG: hypothetical protein J07HX64_02102 [halophilic archaeon J07HX64]|nr:MAG: hypothetical protein J07HX64_02102 [halophilic archaeon J07HX64]